MLEIHNPDDCSSYDGTACLTEIRQASFLLRKAVAYSAKDTKTCFCISKYGIVCSDDLLEGGCSQKSPDLVSCTPVQTGDFLEHMLVPGPCQRQ